MFESLYPAIKGIGETFSSEQFVYLINNIRSQNKKDFVVALQKCLGDLKFDGIERVFRMVIDERKITSSSKYELIKWFGNTAEYVDKAIKELDKYYRPELYESIDTFRLSQLPRSAADIQGFKSIIYGKKALREEVKDFIEKNIGYMSGERELNPGEIREIEELQSKMEVLSVKIGEIHDSLNRFLN